MKKRKYCALSERDREAAGGGDEPATFCHNIVSTTQIEISGPPVSLAHLHTLFPFSHYDRARFAAITIRIAEPDCTALLFTSGKLVVTGSVSWYECVLGAKHVTAMLRAAMPARTFRLVSCEVQNIVAKTSVPLGAGEFLDIDAMYARMNNLCTFQKSMFPGLIFRPPDSPVVLLCFQSGKIVITGGKTADDVRVGWRRLWPQVRQFVARA